MKKLLLLSILAATISQASFADTLYWRFKYGSNNDNFNDGSNWRLTDGTIAGKYPSGSDSVVFDSYIPSLVSGGTRDTYRAHTQNTNISIASLLFNFTAESGSTPTSNPFQIMSVGNNSDSRKDSFIVANDLTLKGNMNVRFSKGGSATTNTWVAMDFGYLDIQAKEVTFESCSSLIKAGVFKLDWEEEYRASDFTNNIASGARIQFQGSGYSDGTLCDIYMGNTDNYGTIAIYKNINFHAVGDNFNNYNSIIVTGQYGGNASLYGKITNNKGASIIINNSLGANTIYGNIVNYGRFAADGYSLSGTRYALANFIGAAGSVIESYSNQFLINCEAVNDVSIAKALLYGTGENNTTIARNTRYVDVIGKNIHFGDLTIGTGFSLNSSDSTDEKNVDRVVYFTASNGFSADKMTVMNNLISDANTTAGLKQSFFYIRSNGSSANIGELTFQGGDTEATKTYALGEGRINTANVVYSDDYAVKINKLSSLGYTNTAHNFNLFCTTSAYVKELVINGAINLNDNNIGAEKFTGTAITVDKISGAVNSTNKSTIRAMQGLDIGEVSLTNGINAKSIIYTDLVSTKHINIDTLNAVTLNSNNMGGEFNIYTDANSTVGTAGYVHIKNLNLANSTYVNINSIGTGEVASAYENGHIFIDNLTYNGGGVYLCYRDRGTAENVLTRNVYIGSLNSSNNGGYLTTTSGTTYTNINVIFNGSSKSYFSGTLREDASVIAKGTVFNVVKEGTGTQVLSGTNTWTGSTAVKSGALLLNRSDGLGTITIANSGRLGAAGNGLFVDKISKDEGGAFMFDFSLGSNMSIKLKTSTDLIGEVLAGDFIYSNTSSVIGNSILLFTFNDGIANSYLKQLAESDKFYNYVDEESGQLLQGKYSELNGNIYVVLSEVPEPATCALLLALMALSLAFWRKSKKQ